LQLENGLPLGLAAESVYPEITFQFPENTQLTLVTDGVVEARARTGELLGFERAAVLSTQPAESIARAPQTFGQEDDITVLTLLRRSPEAQPESGRDSGSLDLDGLCTTGTMKIQPTPPRSEAQGTRPLFDWIPWHETEHQELQYP
jgi:hypothetical protein